MNNDDLYQLEVWKDIPIETAYRYQVSSLGRVRRIKSDGTEKLLSIYHEKANNIWKVGLTVSNGSIKKYSVSHLVAIAFIGPCDRGYIAAHKNGIKSDNRLENIEYVEFRRAQKLSSDKNKKVVVKINSYGEIEDYYNSATECARQNSFSRSAITDRCRKRIKGIIAPDGYAYCYEIDHCRIRDIRRYLGGKNERLENEN